MSGTDSVQADLAKRARWLRNGLIASLAVNLLVLGALAGHFLAKPHKGQGPETTLAGFSKTLPGDRQQVLNSAVEADRQSVKQMRQEIRRARREASAVLAAEPFDQAQLKTALEKIVELDSRLKSTGTAIFVEAASKMTPAERRAFKDWRERHRPHWFREDIAGHETGAPSR